MNSLPETLKKQYQHRFQANKAYRNQVWSILCKNFLSKYILAESILLDLGAGWGEFTRNISAKKKYAMDLNPDCKDNISKVAEFIQQDCAEPWPFPDETLDIVFSSNFLEHLPNKEAVAATLSEAYRCLKKGGKIILLGPNIRFTSDVYWDYWDHHVPISDKSITELLTLKQFNVSQVIGRFLPYTMSGSKNSPLFFIKLYLKLPFLWPLFGKQFFVLAYK